MSKRHVCPVCGSGNVREHELIRGEGKSWRGMSNEYGTCNACQATFSINAFKKHSPKWEAIHETREQYKT